jgi:hypothetical protein
MFDLDRYDDGYLLTLFPPLVAQETVTRSLSPRGVRDALGDLSVDPRDVEDAIMAADAAFTDGTRERGRALRRAVRSAQAGRATPADIELLRREAQADDAHFRRTSPIRGLYLAGAQDEAVALLLRLMRISERSDELQLSLRLLSEWRPYLFEREVLKFLSRDYTGPADLRTWAMVNSAALLRDGNARSLLNDLVEIALDPTEDVIARKDARNALTQAAGLDARAGETNRIIFSGTAHDVMELVRLIRSRWNELDRLLTP